MVLVACVCAIYLLRSDKPHVPPLTHGQVKSGSIVAAGAVVPPNTTIPSGQVSRALRPALPYI